MVGSPPRHGRVASPLYSEPGKLSAGATCEPVSSFVFCLSLVSSVVYSHSQPFRIIGGVVHRRVEPPFRSGAVHLTLADPVPTVRLIQVALVAFLGGVGQGKGGFAPRSLSLRVLVPTIVQTGCVFCRGTHAWRLLVNVFLRLPTLLTWAWGLGLVLHRACRSSERSLTSIDYVRLYGPVGTASWHVTKPITPHLAQNQHGRNGGDAAVKLLVKLLIKLLILVLVVLLSEPLSDGRK